MEEIFGLDYIEQLLDYPFKNVCEDCPYRVECSYENKSNCCEGKFNRKMLNAERIA